MTSTDMLHVPYKGAAAVITAVRSGEITSSFAPAKMVKDAKIKIEYF